jgi:hypothetical protein
MGMFGSMGKALGGALGHGAKPMAGTAQGSVAPAGPAGPGALGLLARSVAGAQGRGAPAGGRTKPLAAPSLALGVGGPGLAAAAPALGKKPPKKTLLTARGMRGGRR